MKYKDYLIIPALAMYLLFASCAYLATNKALHGKSAVSEPSAGVCPEDICWGTQEGDFGEYWYAEGVRGAEYFTSRSYPSGAVELYFSSGNKNEGSVASRYIVSDMHMKCRTDSGRKYDIIFTDEMTAYDTISGIYYQRADYEAMVDALTSGKFVNVDNPNDYYLFKDNGKSKEYFGNKVYNGRWTLATSDSLVVYDYKCKADYNFALSYDKCGRISGFTFGEVSYKLKK